MEYKDMSLKELCELIDRDDFDGMPNEDILVSVRGRQSTEFLRELLIHICTKYNLTSEDLSNSVSFNESNIEN